MGFSLKFITITITITILSSISYAEEPKFLKIPLALKYGEFCLLVNNKRSLNYYNKMADNISKELIIYDYKIKSVNPYEYIELNKNNFKITSHIDYSMNDSLYIPNILAKELYFIVEYNKRKCLFVTKKLIMFFNERLKEIKIYKVEINKLNIFLKNINLLISSNKPISSRENDLVWMKNSSAKEIKTYSKYIADELKSIGNIKALSPSIFSIEKLSKDNNGYLVITINMIYKDRGKLFDRLILIYVDKKWRIAVPML